MRPVRVITGLLAAVAVSAGLAACGGVPSDSVATVADSPILKSEFNHWMDVSSRTQGGGPINFIYSPPDFPQCIAVKKAESTKQLAKGQTPPTSAQLKTVCKSSFDQAMPQVMQLLLSSAWIKGQAAKMGISASDADVKKEFEVTKKAAFPTDKAYKAFLKQSGESEQDLFARIRVQLLAQRIRAQLVKEQGKVTDEQVKAFYEKNQAQLGKPEQRDIQLILTKDEAKAKAAKAAVASGTSWADAAKQYSTDAQTKDSGGVIKGATKGSQDPAVDAAAFAAKPNVVVGPVKGAFGWYVIDVTKVIPGNVPPFAKIKDQLRQQVANQKQEQALQEFVKKFQTEWKSKTICAEYYVMELCSNAPKPKQQSAPVPGATTTEQAPSGG